MKPTHSHTTNDAARAACHAPATTVSTGTARVNGGRRGVLREVVGRYCPSYAWLSADRVLIESEVTESFYLDECDDECVLGIIYPRRRIRATAVDTWFTFCDMREGGINELVALIAAPEQIRDLRTPIAAFGSGYGEGRDMQVPVLSTRGHLFELRLEYVDRACWDADTGFIGTFREDVQ